MLVSEFGNILKSYFLANSSVLFILYEIYHYSFKIQKTIGKLTFLLQFHFGSNLCLTLLCNPLIALIDG